MFALSFFLSILYVYIYIFCPESFEKKFQIYVPLALNISVCISKNQEIVFDNLSIMIKIRKLYIYF